MPKTTENPMMAGDCPRCGQQRTTFDLLSWTLVDHLNDIFESSARCRKCFKTSVAMIRNAQNNDSPANFEGQFVQPVFSFRQWVIYVPAARTCPEFVPEEIQRIFYEAAKCEAMGLWDAAGAMFRKVLDAATRSRTPIPVEGDPSTPAWKVYKDLRLRLDWLFDRKLLDDSLRDLSSCIHQDGNDAAHDLDGIGKEEATDLGDFSEIVLRTIYTLPGQVAENQRRREERRAGANTIAE